MPDPLAHAVDVLSTAGRILVFTGAGISTESGIPDFRGPDGLWSRLDPDDFTIDRYLASSRLRKERWRMHLGRELWSVRGPARPNRGHAAVVDLWRAGLLTGCVTQNIDGLHRAAGLPDEALAELHGNAHTSQCTGCSARWPTEEVLRRVEAGDEDPHCPLCGGIVKTAIVMFGEHLPDEEVRRAAEMARTANAVLVVGSTLSVYPAADIALAVVAQGGPMVIVNLGPTEHDALAAACVEAPAGEALPALAAALAGPTAHGPV